MSLTIPSVLDRHRGAFVCCNALIVSLAVAVTSTPYCSLTVIASDTPSPVRTLPASLKSALARHDTSLRVSPSLDPSTGYYVKRSQRNTSRTQLLIERAPAIQLRFLPHCRPDLGLVEGGATITPIRQLSRRLQRCKNSRSLLCSSSLAVSKTQYDTKPSLSHWN